MESFGFFRLLDEVVLDGVVVTAGADGVPGAGMVTRSSELVDFSSSAWTRLTGLDADEVVATDADL